MSTATVTKLRREHPYTVLVDGEVVYSHEGRQDAHDWCKERGYTIKENIDWDEVNNRYQSGGNWMIPNGNHHSVIGETQYTSRGRDRR